MSRTGASVCGAAVFATLVAAGCMSYRPVPPLDEEEAGELAALAPRLCAERVRVVAANEHSMDAADDIEAAVRLVGGTVDEEAPTVTIEAQEPRRSLEEPFLNVLTLGFLPHYGRGEQRDHWRLVAEDGRQIAGDVSTTSPHWIGWLVGPVALLPGWRLSATWDREEQRRERRSDARRMRIALGLARSIERLRGAAE